MVATDGRWFIVTTMVWTIITTVSNACAIMTLIGLAYFEGGTLLRWIAEKLRS